MVLHNYCQFHACDRNFDDTSDGRINVCTGIGMYLCFSEMCINSITFKMCTKKNLARGVYTEMQSSARNVFISET